MERDDAARKVRGLLRHSTGTGDEAVTAKALADKLIAKYGLTQDDLDPDNDEPNKYLRQYKKKERLERDVLDSLARFASWLGEDAQAYMRREDAYARIEAQLKAVKNQFKVCEWCRKDGFGGRGPTERYHAGFKNNRNVYASIHPKCLKSWREYQQKLKEKLSGAAR